MKHPKFRSYSSKFSTRSSPKLETVTQSRNKELGTVSNYRIF